MWSQVSLWWTEMCGILFVSLTHFSGSFPLWAPPRLLLYYELPVYVTIKSLSDNNVTFISKLLCNAIVTFESLHNEVTWWLSQSNDYGDFTVESTNNVRLRVKKWLHCDVICWLVLMQWSWWFHTGVSKWQSDEND